MTDPLRYSPRLFTLEAANALVPRLEELLARFDRAQEELRGVREDLSVLRLVASSGSGHENPDRRALLEAERRAESLARKLARIQREMLSTGCVPKSLQDGLIDFFALNGDRIVFLCWRRGEERVEHWHTLEGGFQGRRPASTLDGPEGI